MRFNYKSELRGATFKLFVIELGVSTVFLGIILGIFIAFDVDMEVNVITLGVWSPELAILLQSFLLFMLWRRTTKIEPSDFDYIIRADDERVYFKHANGKEDVIRKDAELVKQKKWEIVFKSENKKVKIRCNNLVIGYLEQLGVKL